MGHVASSLLVSFGLFVGIFVCWEAGRRLALRRRKKDAESENVGIGAVEGAVFGLMGLMLAFSFSGAMTRWDARRQMVVEEANDIGTAWLRIALLPQSDQLQIRELFRRYVDSRIAIYAAPDAENLTLERLAPSSALQQEIWNHAVAACSKPEGDRARILLLEALNAMFDITTTRRMATKSHPPQIINVLLIGLVLASSLLAGSAMADNLSRGWVHMTAFALVMSVCIYMVFDLEYPRIGLIRIDAVDQVIVDLRSSMN